MSMNVSDVLSRLEHLGIHITASNGKLLVDAPRGMISDRIRTYLRDHKAEILSLLEEQRLEQFGQAVSRIAGIFGNCEISPLPIGTTLAQWLTEQGIPFEDDEQKRGYQYDHDRR